MKKIGLVTIVDYSNYGNRLQNFAAQQVLKSLGCNVTTIVNKSIDKEVKINNKFNIIKRIKGKGFIDIKNKLIYTINRKSYESAMLEKIEKFKKFTKKNINETSDIWSVDSIPNNAGDIFDFYVVGSDQVWNPEFRQGSSFDFLTFAPEYKRIAYSPSFGASEIPIIYKDNYKKWLSEFRHLSVRETAGEKIIRDLTGRDAEVLVDPTMMLTKEEWISVSYPAASKPKNNYLLTYLLGKETDETKELIREISQKYNLEIVRLGNLKDIERYPTDPGEFIDYIRSSSIFLTDSFHGAVFSILLEIPFIIFDRVSNEASMNSRIDTLLYKFQLEERKWENIKRTNNYYDVDFSNIPKILEVERKKANSYLKKALQLEDAK